MRRVHVQHEQTNQCGKVDDATTLLWREPWDTCRQVSRTMKPNRRKIKSCETNEVTRAVCAHVHTSDTVLEKHVSCHTKLQCSTFNRKADHDQRTVKMRRWTNM